MTPTQWLNYQQLEWIPTSTSAAIELAVQEVWSGEAKTGFQIVCQRGTVWITQSNDSHDHILHPGQQFLATCSGRVVVQALTVATITIV